MAQFLGAAVASRLSKKEPNAVPQSDRHSQLLDALSQLATVATTTAALVRDFMQAVSDSRDLELSEHVPFCTQTHRRNVQAFNGRPVADRPSYSICWRGKTCFLGNTLPFRLFAQLAHHPNRFYTYDELLCDVWKGCRSQEAIRSVVKVLRRKLREAGMGDLATAISGNAWNNLGLNLDGQT
jgi:DNA-binding response OmpR family regulator